jgi:transcriptional regulator with XRE-family HTH domain
MNYSNAEAVTQPVRIFRPGLLDRLKTNNGIRSDEALARLMGISRSTLQNYRNGSEPSLRAVVLLADAFGLALGEVLVKPEDDEQHEAVGA